MKCESCPALATEGYEYPEEYCSIGVPDDDMYEDKNGNWGCRMHPATIKDEIEQKTDAEYRDWIWGRRCRHISSSGIMWRE